MFQAKLKCFHCHEDKGRPQKNEVMRRFSPMKTSLGLNFSVVTFIAIKLQRKKNKKMRSMHFSLYILS